MKKQPSKKVTKAFIAGFKKLGYTTKQLDDFKYCGGCSNSSQKKQSDRHLKYFKLVFGEDKEMPEYKNKCICGINITKNIYITNKKDILVIGNECKNHFIKKSGRTCELCGDVHKRRLSNRCKNCKNLYSGKCSECNTKCNPIYSKCYTCKYKINNCWFCDKKISIKYAMCYACKYYI